MGGAQELDRLALLARRAGSGFIHRQGASAGRDQPADQRDLGGVAQQTVAVGEDAQRKTGCPARAAAPTCAAPTGSAPTCAAATGTAATGTAPTLPGIRPG